MNIVNAAVVESQQNEVVNQAEVPAPNEEAALEIIQQLKQGKRVKVAYAKAKGVKFAFASNVNREVRQKHVDEIGASVQKIGRFLRPILVITAKEYFTWYPDRTIIVDGKKITKDSSDLNLILVIVEGQHRHVAEVQLMQVVGYKPTLMVEYIDMEGLEPDKWMSEMNCLSANWSNKDRAHYMIALEPDPNTNLYVANEWQKEYGMGERAAYAILNLDDTYRKAEQLNYMANPSAGLSSILKGTDAHIKRGKRIMHSFEVGFRAYPKMLRNMAAVSLAIDIYKAGDDDDKTKVVNEIVLFFMTLDQTVARNADAASGVAAKKQILSNEWNRMSKQFSTDLSRQALSEQAVKAEEDWRALKEKTTQEKIQKEAKKAKKKEAKVD